MHLNVSVETLYKYVGHDGSEIYNPEIAEPWCRRAFHERELIDVAYEFRHWMIRIDRDIDHINLRNYNDARLFALILQHPTIICGAFPTQHAVACDTDSVFDPKGYVTPRTMFLEKWQQRISSIYVIKSF